MKKNNYVFYLDFLRVLSMFAVIILHVAAQNFEKVTIGSFAWNVFNITDSLVRWSVPILIMISGVFFLDKASELIKKGAHNVKEFSKNKLGEDNYNAIASSKDELVEYTKEATEIIGDVSSQLWDSGKEKIKNWYEEFRNN